MFLVAVLGLLMLAAALVLGTRGAERIVARALGLTGFRWFDVEQSSAPPWKRWLVRAVSTLVPYLLCAGLFLVATVADGTPETTTTVLVIANGPAQAAGMKDGDRVLTVGGAAVGTFDELRARIQAQSAPVAVVVERAGQHLELSVIPKDGRIGVSSKMAQRDVGAVAATSIALRSPLRVVAEASKAFVDWRADTQLRGPVGIVAETSTTSRGGWSAALRLFATLGSYLWPFVAGAHLFDELTGWLFRAASRTFEDREPTLRLGRLRFSMHCALGCWLAALIAQTAVGFDVPGARLLFALAMPGVWATWPLLWVSATQLWTSRRALALMLPVTLVPCTAPLAGLAVTHVLSRERRRLRSHQ